MKFFVPEIEVKYTLAKEISVKSYASEDAMQYAVNSGQLSVHPVTGRPCKHDATETNGHMIQSLIDYWNKFDVVLPEGTEFKVTKVNLHKPSKNRTPCFIRIRVVGIGMLDVLVEDFNQMEVL